jgi:hypothetical protein
MTVNRLSKLDERLLLIEKSLPLSEDAVKNTKRILNGLKGCITAAEDYPHLLVVWLPKMKSRNDRASSADAVKKTESLPDASKEHLTVVGIESPMLPIDQNKKKSSL